MLVGKHGAVLFQGTWPPVAVQQSQRWWEALVGRQRAARAPRAQCHSPCPAVLRASRASSVRLQYCLQLPSTYTLSCNEGV